MRKSKVGYQLLFVQSFFIGCVRYGVVEIPLKVDLKNKINLFLLSFQNITISKD